ncbi:MAG: cytochrome c biogenesis protein CcsA [Planctomycetota bacterium]|nr:cytochrome c biogenesis protein CcsA [Planctomycetota bacterium]
MPANITPDLVGNWSFVLALLASAVALAAAIVAAVIGSRRWLEAATWAMHALTAGLTVALMALLAGFLDNVFRIEYVALNSTANMPWPYKVAALWAGQEGSVLLWAWMLAGMSSIALALRGREALKSTAATTAILAALCVLFCGLLLWAANPFRITLEAVRADRQGMNPLLQDPAMILHPPALFLGYAGSAIPFALMFGALLAGRKDKDWVPSARRWAAAAWLFLTVGILLGAYWAYYTLGWGGYWAWDPVENASLLPWFTATGVMHSLVMVQRRGTLKFWSAAMTTLTPALCFFASFLARSSGILQSVHSFPTSPIGWTFLAMFGLTVLYSLAMVFWRYRLLQGERPLENWVSLPGALTLANVLLVAMMLAVAVGTMYPWISAPFTEREGGVVLKGEFYNTVVLPMGMLLVALMALGPILRVTKDLAGLARRSILPAAAGVVVTAAAALLASPWNGDADADSLRLRTIWTLVCVFVVAFGAVTLFEDFLRTLSRSLRDATVGLGEGLGRFVRAHASRYAAMSVHLGTLLLVLGVLGSGPFKTHLFDPTPGHKRPPITLSDDPRNLGRYTLALTSPPRDFEGPNYAATEVEFLLTGPGGSTVTLTPQSRLFGEQRMGHPSFRSTLRDDVQVILEGWDGEVVFAQAIVFPLMIWVWLGGCVMAAGALACVVLIRRKSSPDENDAPAPLPLVPPAPQGVQ